MEISQAAGRAALLEAKQVAAAGRCSFIRSNLVSDALTEMGWCNSDDFFAGHETVFEEYPLGSDSYLAVDEVLVALAMIAAIAEETP